MPHLQTAVSDEAAASLVSAEGSEPVHTGEHLEVFSMVPSIKQNVAEYCVNLVRPLPPDMGDARHARPSRLTRPMEDRA